MLPAFQLSCSDMVTKWKKLSVGGSCELDVWPYLENLTGDVISRTAFGSSYEEGRRIFQLQKERTHLASQVTMSVYIPGWRFLSTKMNRRMKKISKEVYALLRGIINKREKAMKAGKTANSEDLLGILMESNFREIQEHQNNKKIGMSAKDVIEECKLFYLAGQETTSVLLLWTMLLLSEHPNWQACAREEVLQVTMIFHEVLRLYPLVAMLNRAVYKDTQVGDMYFPARVQVALPTILVHHDHEIWGDNAKGFDPERFAEGILKATKTSSACIGQNFAMMEAKIALAMILQHFSFELSPSYAHAPFNILTMQPQYGVHLILRGLQC
ncbi:Cytochrome P450 CYP72A219 [Vitis vinifera]|uniref:Cytochrome P450 CYP72A219 n=1 Tax=Vitis vinifera TaxID=29760 RepID=A0A438HJK1_VITVI|nr:Cytochrome P450 CYP72A219 [Vitis vinifera]